MILSRRFVTILLAGMFIIAGFSSAFSQMTPANPDAIVTVANNWLALSQEMGWGWETAADFTSNSIQEIEFEGEVLAFSLPVTGGGYVVIPAYHELPPITAYSMNSLLDIDAEDGFGGMLPQGDRYHGLDR